MGSTVEAKAKVRNRHKNAILHFLEWKSEHPKATLEEQVKQFDWLVDFSKVQEYMDAP